MLTIIILEFENCKNPTHSTAFCQWKFRELMIFSHGNCPLWWQGYHNLGVFLGKNNFSKMRCCTTCLWFLGVVILKTHHLGFLKHCMDKVYAGLMTSGETVEKVPKQILGWDAEKNDFTECTTINDLIITKGHDPRKPPVNYTQGFFDSLGSYPRKWVCG